MVCVCVLSCVNAMLLGQICRCETNLRVRCMILFDCSVTWVDSACDGKLSIGRLVKYMDYRIPDVIVGPPCSTGETSSSLLSSSSSPSSSQSL